MLHVDDEALQRMLHGELDPTVVDETYVHLVVCDECRARVADAQRDEDEILQLLHRLDRPSRAVSLAQVQLLARGRTSSLRRIAALLALSAGALAAAYIAPGSPLRRAVSPPVSRAPAVDLSPAARTPSEVGVAISAGTASALLFAASQQTGTAILSLVDGTDVEVRTMEGGARFTVDNRRVLIDNHGSSTDFRIRIGRSTPRVEVRVDGRLVFLKSGQRIESLAKADGDGSYPVSLKAP